MEGAVSPREHLDDGGVACVPWDGAWLLVACVGAPEATAALRKRAGTPALAVAFASWLEASLFVEPPGAGAAPLDRLLPGPLALRCDATPGMGLEAYATGGGVEVHVPRDGLLRALLAELGPLAMLPLDAHGDESAARRALAGLPCLLIPGRAGREAVTLVDARGARPVVLREGVIPLSEVEAAWGSS